MSKCENDISAENLSKRLFIKHLITRILIVANMLILYPHFDQYITTEIQLAEAANSGFARHVSRSQYPSIVQEAIESLIVEDVATYRYEIAWQAWDYLQYDNRKFVIESLANNIEKMPSVNKRIDALQHVYKLPNTWRMKFAYAYDRAYFQNLGDPFDQTENSYYDIVTVEDWQLNDELKYIALISRLKLDKRYCLVLNDETKVRKKFLEYVMEAHRLNEKNETGNYMLLLYFVNYPNDASVTYDNSIPRELIESSLVEAIKFLLKHDRNKAANNLEYHLKNLKS